MYHKRSVGLHVPSFPLILYVQLSLSACVSEPSFTPSSICTFLSFFSLSEPSFLLFLYPYLPLLFLCKHFPFSASVFVSSFLRLPVPSFPHSSICTYLTPPLFVLPFPIPLSVSSSLSSLCLPFSASLYASLFLSSCVVYLPFSTSLSVHFYARHFLPRRRSRKCIPSAHWCLPTKLHDVICRKTVAQKSSYISKKQWHILWTTNVPSCATGMPSRVRRLGRRHRTVARYPALKDAGHPAKVSPCRWWHMLRNSKKLTSSTAFLHANQAVMKIVS